MNTLEQGEFNSKVNIEMDLKSESTYSSPKLELIKNKSHKKKLQLIATNVLPDLTDVRKNQMTNQIQLGSLVPTTGPSPIHSRRNPWTSPFWTWWHLQKQRKSHPVPLLAQYGL